MRPRRAALAVLATLVAVAAAEGVLRATWFRGDRLREGFESPRYRAFMEAGMLESVPRETRRYRLRPGASAEIEGVRYAVNSLGFRGEEFPHEKPAGVYRLLVLGDSFAFGWEVSDADSIPGRLAAHLGGPAADAGGTRVEVVNAGVPGYHTGQQADLLRHEGLALAPDGVLVVYYANDMIDEAFFYDDARGVLYADAMPIPFEWRRRLRGFALYAFASKQWTRRLYQSGRLHGGTDLDWVANRRAILDLRDLCAERGIALVVATIPLLTNAGDLARDDHASASVMARVEDLLDAEAIPRIDLLPTLRREPVELSTSADGHFNPRGSAAVAETIAQNLRVSLAPRSDEAGAAGAVRPRGAFRASTADRPTRARPD